MGLSVGTARPGSRYLVGVLVAVPLLVAAAMAAGRTMRQRSRR